METDAKGEWGVAVPSGRLYRQAIFLEDLIGKCLGRFRAEFFYQQVYADNGQLFGAAWAVRTLSLLPFRLDVGVNTDVAHGWTRCVKTLDLSKMPLRCHQCGSPHARQTARWRVTLTI